MLLETTFYCITKKTGEENVFCSWAQEAMNLKSHIGLQALFLFVLLTSFPLPEWMWNDLKWRRMPASRLSWLESFCTWTQLLLSPASVLRFQLALFCRILGVALWRIAGFPCRRVRERHWGWEQAVAEGHFSPSFPCPPFSSSGVLF